MKTVKRQKRFICCRFVTFPTRQLSVTSVRMFFCLVSFKKSVYYLPWGGDVAQLVVHRTGTSPKQVRFPGAARDFSPSADSPTRRTHSPTTRTLRPAGKFQELTRNAEVQMEHPWTVK